MANIPVEIIQLTPADPITGDEDIPAWQAGKTVRIKASALKPINSVNGITPNNAGDIIVAGADIPLDVSQFAGILNTAHSNVQLALDVLDNAVAIAGGAAAWGGITGNITNQVDLRNSLNAKLNTSVSSVFVQTSQMNNYALTNHSHSQYLTTAAQSIHTHAQYLTTAAPVNHSHSDYLNTSLSYLSQNYSTHTHSQYITSQTVQSGVQNLNGSSGSMNIVGSSNISVSNVNGSIIIRGKTDFPYVNTSQSSLFQTTGNYITTAMASNAGSNFVSVSQSSLFQHTSATSNITANALNTSVSSLFQHTSATSNITANALNTSQSSLFQATSLMTNYQAKGNYLTTAMASDAGSNFVNTSQSSRFQLTADMSAYLTAGYTTHSHTQYQLINNMSNYEAVTHTSVFQQTSQMSLYAVKSRIDGGTP